MKRSESAEIVEKINFEYLSAINSKEYIYGKRILKLISIKKGYFSTLIHMVKSFANETKLFFKVTNRFQKQFAYSTGNYLPEAKGIVYTCITRNYDIPLVPYMNFENIKYVLLTDKLYDRLNVWEQVDVKSLGFNQEGNYINRYCKMHPHDLFGKDADFSVYIDGNIQIISDVAPLYQLAKKSKSGIALHYHSKRNNVYDESIACLIYKRGNADKIKQQIDFYHVEEFPPDFPLFEANVIVADLNNPNSKLIMEAWWDEFERSESRRDQLSLPYILWKLGFSENDIGVLGTNVNLNPKFRVMDSDTHQM